MSQYISLLSKVNGYRGFVPGYEFAVKVEWVEGLAAWHGGQSSPLYAVVSQTIAAQRRGELVAWVDPSLLAKACDELYMCGATGPSVEAFIGMVENEWAEAWMSECERRANCQ